jgi:hypothetical protein
VHSQQICRPASAWTCVQLLCTIKI